MRPPQHPQLLSWSFQRAIWLLYMYICPPVTAFDDITINPIRETLTEGQVSHLRQLTTTSLKMKTDVVTT